MVQHLCKRVFNTEWYDAKYVTLLCMHYVIIVYSIIVYVIMHSGHYGEMNRGCYYEDKKND